MGPQRCRYRDAEDVEGVGIGKGVSPPQPTRGSGERGELSRAESRPQTRFRHFMSVAERFR